MSPSSAPIAALRVSTQGLADPAAALRRLNERGTMLPLQPLGGLPCGADIVKWPLEQLGLMSARLAGVRHGVGRAGPPTAADDDQLYLGMTMAGTSLVTRRGREATLRDGEAALLWARDAFMLTHPGAVHIVGLRLSRERLGALLDVTDPTAMQLIRRDSSALALLLRYSLIAAQDSAHWSLELQRLAVRQIYELSALAVSTPRDVLEERVAPSVRAARLRLMKAAIEARLDEPDLDAHAIARQHAVSARYVHKLFEQEGLSCAAFILSLRLARVHRQLTDPACAARSISTLAYQAGFNDLSHFGRHFRRRYGRTPSDVRRGP